MAACQQLMARGWLMCRAEEVRALCAAVYGTADLAEVRLSDGPARLVTLGNPLEALVLFNWTGTPAPFARRIWYVTAGATV